MSFIDSFAANDIVDLQERDSHFKNIHPRFFEKVFTQEERELVTTPNKNYLYWAIWAAKEAAYKYVVQKEKKQVFAYQEFKVCNSLSKVYWKNLKIPVTIYLNKKFIYAITQEPNFNLKKLSFSYISDSQTWKKLLSKNLQIEEIFQRVKKSNKTNHEFSWAVRSIAIFFVSHLFSKKSKEISIDNLPILGTHIPAVFCNNKILSIRLSFTHHGDFFAVHFFYRNSPQKNLPEFLDNEIPKEFFRKDSFSLELLSQHEFSKYQILS